MPDAAPTLPNPIDPPESAKRDARKCFEHALKAAESKNYDYAIELYLQGLELWPGAIEEGLYRFSDEVGSNALEVLVSRLRKKLTTLGADINLHTVRGVGYVLKS